MGNPEIFDPMQPKSLCYRPMGRSALEDILSDAGDPLGGKQSEHLDLIYGRTQEIIQQCPPLPLASGLRWSDLVAAHEKKKGTKKRREQKNDSGATDQGQVSVTIKDGDKETT